MKYESSMEPRFKAAITAALKRMCGNDTSLPAYKGDGSPAPLREYLKKQYGNCGAGSPDGINYSNNSKGMEIKLYGEEYDDLEDSSLLLSWSQIATFTRKHIDEIFNVEEFLKEKAKEHEEKMADYHAEELKFAENYAARYTEAQIRKSKCSNNKNPEGCLKCKAKCKFGLAWLIKLGYSVTIEGGDYSISEKAPVPTEVPAEPENAAAFNYSELDEETGTQLRLCEQVIRQQTAGYFTLLGEKLKEAQDLLADHGNGTFEKWYSTMGFKRQTVYNLIQRYEFMSSPTIGEHTEEFEKLPLTLSYAVSDPKAPQELVEKVLDGDITTHKDYVALKKELEEAHKKIEADKNTMQNMSASFNRVADASKKNYERWTEEQKKSRKLEQEIKEKRAEYMSAVKEKDKLYCEKTEITLENDELREKNSKLEKDIKELEKRPVEVITQPDEEAIAKKDEEIERLKKENASLRRNETRSVIIKATMDQVVEIMKLIEENFGRSSELYQAISSARPLRIE